MRKKLPRRPREPWELRRGGAIPTWASKLRDIQNEQISKPEWTTICQLSPPSAQRKKRVLRSENVWLQMLGQKYWIWQWIWQCHLSSLCYTPSGANWEGGQQELTCNTSSFPSPRKASARLSNFPGYFLSSGTGGRSHSAAFPLTHWETANSQEAHKTRRTNRHSFYDT